MLFRISAALLKKNEAALVAASTRDSTELFMEMKKIGHNELDADALISMAYKSYIPPVMRQRSLFTSSRSTGNLANSSRRGARVVDAPLRKYNEASTVPLVLVGLGVAHTGPVLPPSPVPSPLQSSNPYHFPPRIMDPSLVHLNKENENTYQIDHENDMKLLNQAQDPYGNDSKINSFREIKSKSEKLHRPKSAVPESYLMPLSLPISCLPELHVGTSFEEMLKIPVTATEQERLTSRQEEIAEATQSITDCCFNRAVMIQLGMSALRSISNNAETKTSLLPSEVIYPSNFSSSTTTTTTSHTNSETGKYLSEEIRTACGAPTSPLVSRSTSPRTPTTSGMSGRIAWTKKSKNHRNASSLFNILLSSHLSSNSNNGNDEYRNFKRGDIDGLREAFRQILTNRFS